MRRHKPLILGEARNDVAVTTASEKRYLTHLAVRKGDRIVILRVPEIEALESAGNYDVVQAGKDTFIVRETLTANSARNGIKPGHCRFRRRQVRRNLANHFAD